MPGTFRGIPLWGFMLLTLAASSIQVANAAADASWPRELKTDDGILTIYQPQPETFVGNMLTGRAAASLLSKGGAEPSFGVFWFKGRVETDRDAGTSLVYDIVVTKLKWPDSKPEEEARIGQMITGLMPKTGLPLSLERLKASLATAEAEKQSIEGLKSDPPKIVVVDEIAELLLYDGEPRGVPIPNSQLEQIANAPFAVVRDKSSGTCYLCGGKIWYSAPDPKGPWTSIAKPPAEIAKLVPPDTSSAPTPQHPPKIIVATVPTELIATDGPASWKPIGKGDLMYIDNTESSVLREVATGKVFVLISGRWYAAASLNGPWSAVRPDQTPASFKEIPPASPVGDVRVSVAGTPEADNAILDAQVPQTAAIDRGTAKLEVKYDGTPQFKAITGTGVEYATNTAAQVLRIGGKYYACDNGVWFGSAAATGPWVVADSVPMDEIKKIPPSEPVYNVTYVTVYESTPKVVYVGYTPGYMYSYPYYGCPVYGTGYYYPPYWGPTYYYPRPVTYGMHVGYNPYTGWNCGFTYSNGFMTVGVRFGGGYGGYYRPGYPPGYYRPPGYYPPGGYRPPYHGHGPGHKPGYRPPHNGGYPNGGRPSTLPAHNNNLYGQSASRDRVAPSTMQRDAGLQKADRVAKGPNNVYAGKDGNVYKNTNQGWQSRDQGQWQSPSNGGSPSTRPSQPSNGSQPSTRPSQPSAGSTPSTRPTQPSSGARPSQPSTGASPSTRPTQSPSQAPAGLNRDAQARQTGASRSSQTSSRAPSTSRPSSSGSSRPSNGGSRGGGGGRR